MAEGIPPAIQHRYVDRTKSPYTDETPEALVLRGFEFVCNKDVDDTFDTLDTPIIEDYKEATGQLLENVEKTGALLPSPTAPLDLRTFVLMTLRAGYEVRFIRGADREDHKSANGARRTIDIYRRFDLDRFLSRAEELLEHQGYMQDSSYPLHHWGDNLEHISTARLKEYSVDALMIEKRVRQLLSEGYDVRLKEIQKGGPAYPGVNVYKRTKITQETPYLSESPLIVTEEAPASLLLVGFHFVENRDDDGSIPTEPKKQILFYETYWKTAQQLLEKGMPHEAVPQLKTLKERVLNFRRRGFDVRLIRGSYNESSEELSKPSPEHDRHTFAILIRFDIGSFIEDPRATPEDLRKKGYHFDGNLPFTAWGDALKKIDKPFDINVQNAEIEGYIQKKLSLGTKVRLLWGTYNERENTLDRSHGGMACFKR